MERIDLNIADYIPPGRPMATITVRLKGVRWFQFRIWLGMTLIRLGAWVTGVTKVSTTRG